MTKADLVENVYLKTGFSKKESAEIVEMVFDIMKTTLELAHDEHNEKLRESAVKLLNELAPDMGKELCEFFIVSEMYSLGYDSKSGVR